VLFSSGEALSGETVNKFNRLFSRKRPRLINLYGPTEATIDVSFYECDRVNYDAPVPIGKPIDNICLYVMSRLMQLQPVGVAGELCIAGVGLAKGYVNNPGLTDKKFITWRGQRLYRTGDLAKYDTDGNIIFLGRMDDQVKIRGFRIELSEIEQCLMKHPRVENAVVLQKHTNGDSYLCAFYSSAAMLDEAELNAWLSDFLPEYCIPSVYSYRPVFTFNANGKLDRNALIQEAPHRRADKKTDNGVLSKKELLVLGICQSVLGTGSLSIHSSFISLGGDSIKAIQLQARLAREEYFVGVADILSAPSLKSLCSAIILMEQQRLATEPATGDILLTSVQQQFFSTAFTNPDFFLQGITLVSGQRFDKQLVADAFHHLQAHHDALRTVFRMETDTVTAFIPVEVTPVTPVYIEITENDTAATLLDITGRLRREISISKKQLFRMAVVNTKNAGYLVMVAHHLIVDILSWRILAEDFVHLYDQLKAGKHPQPGRKTSSVKKWGEALHGFSRRKDVLETMKHWMRGSGGEPPASPAAPVKWGAYKRTGVKISRETTKILLSELCPGYKVSMPDIILYILTKSYQVLTDQQYLCVAMEGHGRERIIPDIELNRTVGWFTAIYPVRFEVPAAELSVQGLMNVRDRMQQVPHKGLSYGALRYLSEDPLIRQQLSGNQSDILFNYMSEPDAVGIHNSQVSYYLHSDEQVMHTDNVVGFNMIVSAIIRQHQLELNFDYDSTKYAEQDMNRLTRKMEEFTAQLVSICYHSEIDAGMLADFSDGDLTIAELDKIRQMIR
ncbi:condensation domain-containing protein, partial [Chitinophaga sp.]|uniref:condensation domain-containing protein n=1 Tax=Chitinophaga sp. TaxID=1869181 RepID=UPI002D0589A1